MVATMKRYCLIPILAVLVCAAGPAQVTYTLGGIVSGPYRVAADLATGVVTEAQPPQGRYRDGARLNALTMPVTAHRSLTPAALDAVRGLASQVFADGAFACPDPAKGMMMSADAIGRFDVVQDGVTHASSAATACLTPIGDALLRALTCGIDPQRPGCP